MKDAQIQLRSVNELLTDDSGQPARYRIPTYQRGYRWTELQVKQLLDDIRDFTQRPNPKPDEFYCLQPLVIKARPNEPFEVVDGQQRLTTLLLILRHFNERLTEKYRQQLYSLSYETDRKLDEFLDNPNEEAANKDIDCSHLYRAIQKIESWFEDHENEVEGIKSALLNNTKVIWFTLAENDDPVAAFTRLNVGKISLTNDELIRALFLRRAASENNRQELALRIAHEWDQLEKTLQNDAFWYFISNEPAPKANRIGIVFELVAADELTALLKQDTYGVFHAFNKRLTGETAEEQWLKVKQTFMSLEEWYEDRELFHVVGFLIHQGVPVNKILRWSHNLRKNNFSQDLRREAFYITINYELDNFSDEIKLRDAIQNYCDNILYGSHSEPIRAILLLFNLATLLENQKSNMRFQFDSFKGESWDIEHIRSVRTRSPVRTGERIAWLKMCLDYFKSRNDDKQPEIDIDNFEKLQHKEADDVFEALYGNVLEYFQENDEGGEGKLANLTLLDRTTNRGYKNAVFAVKRKCLLDLDKSGTFVPLCTRNVFLKCYSDQVGNVIFWSQRDTEGYEKAIIDTLTKFFYIQ